MSFAMALLDNVLKVGRENNAKKILRIVVEIGELLLINPEQLKFCFKAISSGTIAENAEIDIKPVKASIKCSVCNRVYNEVVGICKCGGFVEVKGGKEMIIKKIEMER